MSYNIYCKTPKIFHTAKMGGNSALTTDNFKSFIYSLLEVTGINCDRVNESLRTKSTGVYPDRVWDCRRSAKSVKCDGTPCNSRGRNGSLATTWVQWVIDKSLEKRLTDNEKARGLTSLGGESDTPTCRHSGVRWITKRKRGWRAVRRVFQTNTKRRLSWNLAGGKRTFHIFVYYPEENNSV